MSIDFLTGNVSFLLVFMEGILSFFSPCVIPLIPIYMSYLAGNAKRTLEDGTIVFDRKRVFFQTLFFVVGISSAFFILGMSFTALGTFFKTNQLLFTRIGGIIIILFGLVQIGFLEFKFLQRERKLQIHLEDRKINPFLAFVMGFTFSFAWTPCVGPALSSVLIMASSSKNAAQGNLLVLVYTLGFVIPFLLLGLFTTQALNFLKRHQKLLKYTVKAGGILLILIGIMTFTGWMNSFSAYVNRFVPEPSVDNQNIVSEDVTAAPTAAPTADPDSQEPQEPSPAATPTPLPENTKEIIPASDFTLVDQYGKEHTLSDYKGKVVFLNFWATWCPPCKKEMPDIEALYQDSGKNEKDIIVLGVANPVSDEYPNNSDVSKEEVIKFLDNNHYTFPVLFDETGEVLANYYISSFPTTFFIDTKGNIYGYAPAMMTREMMDNALEQTIDSIK